jgi:hypothetical protein
MAEGGGQMRRALKRHKIDPTGRALCRQMTQIQDRPCQPLRLSTEWADVTCQRCLSIGRIAQAKTPGAEPCRP